MDAETILYSPSRERQLTTNAWAFLHALRTIHAAEAEDWPGLLEWAAIHPAVTRQAIRDFAHQPSLPVPELAHLADMLLFLDVRPDDVLLVADPQPWPWQAADTIGATLHRYTGSPANILDEAAAMRASILAVPAPWLESGSFQRRQRLDLRALRIIVTLGAPLSMEAAARAYAWVKSDAILLARAGDRVWGDPLGPVKAKPTMSASLANLLRR